MSNERDLHAQLAMARRQLELGHTDGAIEALRQVLALEPDMADGHALLALTLLDKKRLHAAEHEAGLALALDAESALALHAAGAVCVARRQFKEAEQRFERLLAMSPGDPDPYRMLAHVHGYTNRIDDQKRLLDKALTLDPADPSTHEALADWHIERGQIDDAEHHAQRALQLEPSHAGALVSMGRVLLHRDRLDEAHDHAVWALQTNPSDPAALHLLVSIKSRRSLVLGLWWRWATWMGSLGEGRAIVVLLGAFVLYRVGVITAEHMQHENLASYIQIIWLGICAYTWFGPALFMRSLRKELQTVTLRRDF